MTIDITGVDLCKFVQEVYALSHPQSLGHLHYRDGDLPLAEAQARVNRCKDDKHVAVALDYVNGRSCKMTVHRHGDRLTINDSWFDHTSAQLAELLKRCGIKP